MRIKEAAENLTSTTVYATMSRSKSSSKQASKHKQQQEQCRPLRIATYALEVKGEQK
jgi:hypothetical protein